MIVGTGKFEIHKLGQQSRNSAEGKAMLLSPKSVGQTGCLETQAGDNAAVLSQNSFISRKPQFSIFD